MCNLYRLTKPNHEVAHLFDAVVGAVGNAGMGEVYPGYSGLVVAKGELRSMTWGFPLVLKGKNGQPLKPKPVNNARADKLDGFMWRYAFQERRCLIPVSAGVGRDPPDGGPANTLVMPEACVHVADVHDRMPVILKRADWADWLDGPPDSAGLLCRPYPELMVCERTTDLWIRR